jgi:hypothetical protein
LFLTRRLEEKVDKSGVLFALMPKEKSGPPATTPKETLLEVCKLVSESSDVAPDDLPNELPLMHSIQHAIDMIPGLQSPNL